MKNLNIKLVLLTVCFIFLLPVTIIAEEPEECWVARYNGPGNGIDEAHALAVDANGNVYVTGQSKGDGRASDYATIKYDSSGNEQWVARYNNYGNNTAFVRAIAVDENGNVYVTGNSFAVGTGNDYATIKYDSSGNEQWVARYSGPSSHLDRAMAIAIDENLNVYVTGYSYWSGTYYDYATIKYDSSGTDEWVKRYDGPYTLYYSDDRAMAIAIDANDNVYVTGYSFDSTINYGYSTIKYDSSGTEQWVKRYDNNSDAFATDIAVDASGNVYVTGYSSGGGWSFDYATIKYDSSGNEQWVKRYDGPSNYNYSTDLAMAIAVDSNDNVYVTGYSSGPNTGYDYATIKYDSSGTEQWVARYNGPMWYADLAIDIAVDANGNVYVTGYSTGVGTEYDYATIKYDSSGTEQWVKRYDGPSNSTDQATDIAIDANGNVYVTGYSTGVGTEYDYATIKYGTCECDGDGIPDDQDNCPCVDNSDQADVDEDGEGDVCDTCTDTDGDGYGNSGYPANTCPDDNCPEDDNPDQADADSDGEGDVCDTCTDTDGDGYGNPGYPANTCPIDSCPDEDSNGLDANEDGCIDTIGGLSQLIQTLVDEGVIDEQLQNSLVSKVENAWKSLDKENICTAVHQLEAFINEINAQRDKKISNEAADLVIAYANNVITGLESKLPPGESC